MSNSQQRTRLGQWELEAHPGRLPEISCLPECKLVITQLPKEQKLPILTPDHRYLDNKVLGKSFGSCSFESSWKNAVIKTKRIKQEYTSAYGLRECDENDMMPSLTQGPEKYQAITAPSPALQKTKGAPESCPISNNDATLPPLYVLPSTSAQHFIEGFYKNRGDVTMGDAHKRGVTSWKPSLLKTPGIHGGAGELGAIRLKKYNRCSSLISFPEGSKVKSGYHFTDPVSGAPPPYLKRLSELAALECETVHLERNRRFRRTKKQEI